MLENKKSRVAIFIPSLTGGGAERVAVTLANGFADKGSMVDLVLVQKAGPYLSDVASTVNVVDLHAGRVLTSLPSLVGYLRKARPQVMLSLLDYANVVAVWARMLSGVEMRLVLSEHSAPGLAIERAFSWRTRITPALMRWFYPKADGIVAVSGGVADGLSSNIRLPREKVTVVFNPFNLSKIRASSQEPIDHPWFAQGEPPVLLTVGRLAKEKDFPTLIRAFALVRKQRPAKLAILGEGALRGELEVLVTELGLEGDVALPGFVKNPFAWMHHASLFILSSTAEGLPNVLVEAMACSTPVVSTDCASGPAEILENGKWGRLVPVSDATAMCRAIIATLDEQGHPDVARRAEDFQAEKIIDQYMPVLGISAC